MELESSDSETFVTMLLLIVTGVSWVLMILFLGPNLATLLAAEGYNDLTEIGHATYLEPGVVLVSVFLWLPINAFLTLLCYLRLPYEIEIKIKRR